MGIDLSILSHISNKQNMTYKEIMLDRILDEKTMNEVREFWASTHAPKFGSDCTEDERKEMEYISNEKIQRMPPCKIAAILLERNPARNVDEMVDVLSRATGRLSKDIYTAIFGIGGESDMDGFYSPTENEKMLIQFKVDYAIAKGLDGSIGTDCKFWPIYLKAEWDKVCNTIPEEASNEANEEANRYLKSYMKFGFPSWVNTDK